MNITKKIGSGRRGEGQSGYPRGVPLRTARTCALSLGALDASAEVTQLFIDALVATVDLLHIADCGDAISSERGQHQGHPGANIRAADMLAHQTARANHHSAMRVTEDNLSAHCDQTVDKIEAAFIHLFVQNHRPLRLGSRD